jgi:histone acetyltransferase (RNA polymerase elongator complex component)
MGGTFMSLPADYRDYFVRNLHDALSGGLGDYERGGGGSSLGGLKKIWRLNINGHRLWPRSLPTGHPVTLAPI